MLINDTINEIYTTNFDLLIEAALEKNGFIQNNYYYKYIAESEFQKKNLDNNKRKIIKIHGSIDKFDSIRTTLESINTPQLLNLREQIFKRLFSTGSHETVITIGYSFSDEFDVNLYLEKNEVKKYIIIVEHTNDTTITINQLKDYKNGNNFPVFSNTNCKGFAIKVNTTFFLKKLYELKKNEKLSLKVDKINWKNFLNSWHSQFDEFQIKCIAGGICNSMNLFPFGKKYLKNAYKLAVQSNEIEQIANVLNQYSLSIFRTSNNKKKLIKIIEDCKYAIEIMKKNKTKILNENFIKLYYDLNYRIGRIYKDGLNEYEKALQFYYLVYKKEYKLNETKSMSQTLHEIGNTYKFLKNFKLSEKCFIKSIKLKKDSGYIGGLARTYFEMATLNYVDCKVNIKKIKFYLKEAEKIALKAGEIDLVPLIENFKGNLFILQQKWVDGLNVYKKNLPLCKKYFYHNMIKTANFNMALCEIRLKKYDNAIKLLEENLKKIGDNKIKVFKHNQELAFAFLLNNKPIESKVYFQKNEKNIKTLQLEDEDLARFFLYSSFYFKKENEFEKSKTYQTKSKNIFLKINKTRTFASLKKLFDLELFNDDY